MNPKNLQETIAMQQTYAGLATKLGDLVVKSWAIEAQIAEIKETLKVLDKNLEEINK